MRGGGRAAGAVYLGIDIGTSKVAAVLLDDAGRVVAGRSRAHRAARRAPAGRAEQDLPALLRASIEVVRELPARLRCRARAVGVTGQMHGVALLDRRGRPLTPLVTWQDGRCSEEPGFLPTLCRRSGHVLCPGYGGATLAWYRARRQAPAGAATAASGPDWIAMNLCGAERPAMEASMAHSWGLLDMRHRRWDLSAARRAGIPTSWLPPLVAWGGRVGQVSRAAAAKWGLPAGRPVFAAIGDNQASVLATVNDASRDIALTIGTGAQVSVVVPRAARLAAAGACERRPFAPGTDLLVAASVNGGAAWIWLATFLKKWCRQLGARPPPMAEVFRRLNAAGLRSRREIAVDPIWRPERHAPRRSGAVRGWTSADDNVGALARGVARGIARNLRSMLPRAALRGRTRLVGSGNALRRNPLLRRMAAVEFGCRLVMPGRAEEAAVGAAILAMRAAKNNQAPHQLGHIRDHEAFLLEVEMV